MAWHPPAECRSFLEMGRKSYFAAKPKILWADKYGTKLSIGSYTSIAQEAVIFLGGQHSMDRVSTYVMNAGLETYSRGDVVIGSDCWIGYRVVIMDGVTINHGAVVGACSVVTKNVPPYAIVAGNPAHIIRYRFTQDQIAALLKIQWWNWKRITVRKRKPELTSKNINAFIERYLKSCVDTPKP